MKLRNLKVRPKKESRVAPCAPEFAAMLACWASANDLNNSGPCAESARALAECMKSKTAKLPRSSPTVNYHLARYSKRI